MFDPSELKRGKRTNFNDRCDWQNNCLFNDGDLLLLLTNHRVEDFIKKWGNQNTKS